MSTMTNDSTCSFNALFKANTPEGLSTLRTEALSAFDTMQWPSMRDEAWRYTDTRPIAALDYTGADATTEIELEAIRPFLLDEGMPRLVFADGVFQPGCSTAGKMSGVRIERLADVLASEPNRLDGKLGAHSDWKDDPAAAISTALFTDGVLIEIEEGCSMTEPLHIVFHNLHGLLQFIWMHLRHPVHSSDAVTHAVLRVRTHITTREKDHVTHGFQTSEC